MEIEASRIFLGQGKKRNVFYSWWRGGRRDGGRRKDRFSYLNFGRKGGFKSTFKIRKKTAMSSLRGEGGLQKKKILSRRRKEGVRKPRKERGLSLGAGERGKGEKISRARGRGTLGRDLLLKGGEKGGKPCGKKGGRSCREEEKR